MPNSTSRKFGGQAPRLRNELTKSHAKQDSIDMDALKLRMASIMKQARNYATEINSSDVDSCTRVAEPEMRISLPNLDQKHQRRDRRTFTLDKPIKS